MFEESDATVKNVQSYTAAIAALGRGHMSE
jgi:hypothetical protein